LKRACFQRDDERGAESREQETGVFRFENFEIWQRAADLDLPLFELADRLDRLKLFRFAEQLRAAALSITNNAQRTTNQAQRTKHNEPSTTNQAQRTKHNEPSTTHIHFPANFFAS